MAGQARGKRERNLQKVPYYVGLLVCFAHLLAATVGNISGKTIADTTLLGDRSTVVILTLDEFLAQTTPSVGQLEREETTLSSSSLTGYNGDSVTSEIMPRVDPLPTREVTTTATPTEKSRKIATANKQTSDQLRILPAPAERHHEEEGAASKHKSSASASTSSNHQSTTTYPREQLATAAVNAAEGNHNNNQHHHEDIPHGGHTNNPTSTNSTAKKIPQHWQVRSLLNVTNDYPLAYSQIICGYVWPLMAGLTLFTNLMIVFVLTQRDMRTPTNVVLTAIAIADIIPIVVPVPWFVYLFAMGNEKQVLYPPIACYFYQHSTRSISEVFYFLSTWLNVLLAVQDYLTACKPQLARKYCQIRVVVIEILLLTFLAFLLNLPQALKIVFKPVEFYYNGQLTWGCRAKQAKWFKDLVGEYVALYDDIFTAIIVLFVDGGPAVALITLTSLLIRQLERQRIQGHLLMEQARTASKRRRERHRQQESEASARVLIFVLLAFLAVKIPFATTYTLMIIQSRFEIHFVENLMDFQKAITLTDLVFVLSYPINFTIFCCCSKKFRHKCAQLLGECNANTQSAKNRIMRSFSASYDDEIDDGTLSQICKRYSSSTITSAQQQQNKDLHDGSRITSNGDIGQLDSSHWLTSSNTGNTNKICDGLNHFDSTSYVPLHLPPAASGARSGEQVPVTNAPADFDTQLDDGSICIECIMRYERMKRFHQGRLVAEAAAVAASSLHLNQTQCQQQRDRRKSSQDSTSWPIGPPPPPLPPMRTAQLPEIITTRCESINEQPSSDEGSVEKKPHQRESESQSQRQSLDRNWLLQKRKPSGTESRGTSSIVSSELDLSTADQELPPTTRAGSTSASHDGRFYDATITATGNADQGQHEAASSSTRAGRVKRGSNRSRGLGDTLFGLKQLSGLLRRSSDNSADRSSEANSAKGGSMLLASSNDEGMRGQCLPSSSRTHESLGPDGASKTLEQKSRSLSMSDSKLTTLPNATGMLADIMMSTLLTSTGMHHHRQQSSGDSRGAISEPPIHLAATARLEQLERRRNWRQEKRQQSFRDTCKRR